MPPRSILKDGKKKCSKCGKYKPLDRFQKASHTTTGCHAACDICRRKTQNSRYKTDLKFREYQNLANKKSKLKIKYGLSIEDYEELLKNQNNSCKICSKEFDNSDNNKAARVDHCHTTGRVRGLLCTACNVGLGNFYDNTNFLANAIKYLKETSNGK